MTVQLSLVEMSKISPQTSHDISSLQASGWSHTWSREFQGVTLHAGKQFRDRVLASQSGTHPEGPGV